MLPEQSPVSIPRSRGLKPTIPDYELIRQIGRGSYGDVWLAQGITNVYRAVKVVWRDRFEDPEPFEREFKGLKGFAAVSLTESRHLALLHVGRNEPGGFFYYVMELADDYESGSIIDPDTYVPFTFKELRARRGRVEADEMVGHAIELARGLSALHGKHLIHRDIKPSNVIMVGGVPKLADIGLVTADTDAATFVGTEGFVPPEGPGTAGADIFSLGKLLYEMATGLDRKAYPRLPPGLHEFPDRRPLLELNEILIRACEPDATRRYGSAEALLEDLYLLQAGRSVRRLRSAEKSVRRALSWVAVLGVIAAIAAGGAFVERRRAAEETRRRESAETERDLVARKMAYAGGMARAQRALEMADPGRARRYLAELVAPGASPDLRGIEWFALWNRAVGDTSEVYRGLGVPPFRTFLSPDGRLVAAWVTGHRGILWDARTRQIVRVIPNMDRLEGFSADGRWLIGANLQHQQRWETATGRPDREALETVTYGAQGVFGDDAEVAFSNLHHAVEVWDFDQGRITQSIPMDPLDHGLAGYLYHGTPSRDGRFVLVAIIASKSDLRAWKLELFDVKAGKIIWEQAASELQHGMAVSSDGRYVALAEAYNGEVALFETQTNRLVWERRLATEDIDHLRFSPDDRWLAGGGKDSIVWTVEALTGNNKTEFRGHAGGIQDVAWTADSRLMSSGAEGDVRIWKAPTPEKSAGYSDFLNNAGAPYLATSPDGRYYAATLTDHSVALVDTRSEAPRLVLPDVARVLAFTPSSRELISLDPQGRLRFWPIASPTHPSRELAEPIAGEKIQAEGLSPDQHLLAEFGSNYTLQVRDLQTGRTRFRQPVNGTRWLRFTRDNRYLVKGDAGETMACFDASTGTVLATHTLADRPLSGQVSPDDRWIAVGLDSNEVDILALPDLRPIKLLTTDTGRVNSLAISPDGRRLLVGGQFGSIHIYDTSDWRELVVLSEAEHPTGRGYDGMELLSISANGETLIGYRADGFIRSWDCRPDGN